MENKDRSNFKISVSSPKITDSKHGKKDSVSTKNNSKVSMDFSTPKSVSQYSIKTKGTMTSLLNQTSVFNNFKGDKTAYVKEIDNLAYLANQKYIDLSDKKRAKLTKLAELKGEVPGYEVKINKLYNELKDKEDTNIIATENIKTLENEISLLKLESESLMKTLFSKQEEIKNYKLSINKDLSFNKNIYASKLEEKDKEISKANERINEKAYKNKLKIEQALKLKAELEQLKVSSF